MKNIATQKKVTEKDKLILVAVVLVIIVLIALIFRANKTKNGEQEEVFNALGTPQNDIKIELFTQRKTEVSEITNSYIETRVFYLQFAFLLKDMPECYYGMVKTQKLFENEFHSEALFEYATVMHTFLNKRLELYLYPGSSPKFTTSISIAYRNNVITKQQSDFLHKLRKLRNKKAHQPGVDFSKEIATLYLNSGFNLIESTFI